VTIATYDTAAMSRHRKLFNEREWGLVVADECHHAVAETWKRFREIQSVARLGLSATPVRESGDAKEIYTLIGPPVGTDWGSLFADGWVSKPEVEIITVPWGTDRERENYEMMNGSRMMIEAAKNSAKTEVIRALLADHTDAKAIIFVDWIKQGKDLADELGLPFIYGETNHDDREDIYQQFRDGELEALIISRVGDEGIDLPDAEVAILASTMGSSRSQTGQRAGRTMRPFGDSQVYVLLTKGSGEEDWGRESTQYLGEKGIDISKREWGGSDA
jgi:DNA excision repair protein ERCC-3